MTEIKAAGSIKIAELQKAINLILDHIQNDLKIDEVTLEKSYYWDVCTDQLYVAVDKGQPTEFPVGDLYEDWNFLSSMIRDNDTSGAPALMFIHVAPLLRYIGEKIGQ